MARISWQYSKVFERNWHFFTVTYDGTTLIQTIDDGIINTVVRSVNIFTSSDLAIQLGITNRSSAELCIKWVNSNFLQIVNPSKKARTYCLTDEFEELTR